MPKSQLKEFSLEKVFGAQWQTYEERARSSDQHVATI